MRPTASGGEEPRARRGPRHAAPKKSLLTKLQIPAGKAMALAAMPTAVFVGMGLTPRLALAAGGDDIPFAPGPCVTRSDEPSASASESSPAPSSSPSASTAPSPSASSSAGEKDTEGKEAAGPSPSGSAPAADAGPAEAPEPSASASASASATGTPTPGATPSHSTNPLDPLGLGDALGDLLGVNGKDKEGKDDKSSEDDEKAATSSPSPSTTAGASASSASSAAKGENADGDDEDGKDKAGQKDGKSEDGKSEDGKSEDGDAATEKSKDAIKEAAEQAGAEVEELDDAAKGLQARKDGDIPAGAEGKTPYPCPTADPEALAAATEEQGLPLLPDDPWTLHSSLLTLNGLDYQGIVEVRTYSGQVKKVLKFTASSLDIKDLDQRVVYPQGGTAHVEARPGSTSTIRDGEVTMYTEELKGNLFGLIPITFSPATPPPLNVPFAFFTDVTVVQAGQFGGTLTVPGLHNYITR
ncbi:hypothetical protein AB0O07_13805 [Streptomyces sp. NPDC093085]|uniref:hypothetical protein n=1 Tax=Streptomyces sp. NPDC093085 TaxID=3155068 RepID=UPI00342A51B7